MKKNLLILKRFFKIAFCNLTHYRSNFLFVIFYWLISLSILVIFWKVLFQFLPTNIGEWDFPKLCILNSICYISWGFFVFFWGFHQIPQKVVSGGLDKFLTRPISPILGLLGEEIHLEAIYEILAGFIGLFLFSWYYSLLPNLPHFLISLAVLLLGTINIVLFHGAISLSSFWFGKIDSLQHIVDTMDEFQKYPLSFFPRGLHWFLMFMLPLYFPGAFAAKIYLGYSLPLTHWVAFAGSLLIWFGIFFILYNQCLKRYEANG